MNKFVEGDEHPAALALAPGDLLAHAAGGRLLRKEERTVDSRPLVLAAYTWDKCQM